MIALSLFFVLFALADKAPAQASADTVQAAGAVAAIDNSALLNIRRVFVDRLTGGETAAQFRDLLISALQNTRLFVVTENEEKADAYLRGTAEDLVFTDKFSSSESLGARTNSGEGRNTTKGSTRTGRYGGIGLSENESTHIEERKHEAMASIRLVTKDGDVVWSTTQESLGGKFRGASADVADKITRQLVMDLDKARRNQRLP